VLENRPGAGGTIGARAAAQAEPDGYTLLMANTSTLVIAPAVYKSADYDPEKNFAPIATFGTTSNLLVVHPSVPARTVGELIALAKAKPGTIIYSSPGLGTPPHLIGEMLKLRTGIDIVHVPYKGSTGARNDIISGQIEMMFDSVPTMAPMIEAGRVKALGTSGRLRSPVLPDVPTLAEAGIPGYEATIWIGVMAPAGTPRGIVDTLNREINKILARPDIQESWKRQGANPMVMQPEEFGSYIQSEIDRWAKLIKANGIKVE
jgi:tripartite-type tricarboxylate transporter receptor subunit TctC